MTESERANQNKYSVPDSQLKGGNREQNICSSRGDEYLFWPPRIVWARAQGWLNVRDPFDGTWFSIPARDAPRGWTRIATEAKHQ